MDPSTSKSANIIFIEDVINEDTRTGGNVEDSKEMEIGKDENMASSETCSLDFHRYFEKGIISEDSRSNLDLNKYIEEDLSQLVENAREEITRKEHDELMGPEKDIPIFKTEVYIEKMKMEEDSSQAFLDIDDRIPKNEVEVNPRHTMAKEMDMEVEEAKNNILKAYEEAFGINIEQETRIASAEEENMITSVEKVEKNNEEKNMIASAEKKNEENTIAEENQRIKKPIVWDVIDDKLNKKLKKHSMVTGVVAFAFNSNPFKTVRNFSIATFQDSVIREPCKNEDWLEKLNYFIKKMKITHLHVQGTRQSNYLRKKLNAYVLKLRKRDAMLTCPVCFRKSCSVFKIQTFFKSHYGYRIPIACRI